MATGNMDILKTKQICYTIMTCIKYKKGYVIHQISKLGAVARSVACLLHKQQSCD